MMHSATHCTDFTLPSFTSKVLIILFYCTHINVISLTAISKVRPFLLPFSRNLLSVIMCRSLVPIFTSIGQSLCEVWTAIHLFCMYGFHCADFHGTRNHSRRIMGSSPSLWKSHCCPRPKKARQVRSNSESTLVIFYAVRSLFNRNFFLQDERLTSIRPATGCFATSEGQVRPQRPNLWWNQNCLMHLENAPARTAWWVQQFWVAKSWICFHAFLTRIVWRLEISPSFREWNLRYKGAVSTNSLNFWTGHYMRFPKACCSGVSSSGRTQKGTTLKATTTTRIKEKLVFCYGRGQRTFRYAFGCFSLKISNSPSIFENVVLCSSWSYDAKNSNIVTMREFVQWFRILLPDFMSLVSKQKYFFQVCGSVRKTSTLSFIFLSGLLHFSVSGIPVVKEL